MANIVADRNRQSLVMAHVDHALEQFEKRLGKALYRMQCDALYGIAVDERMNGKDYNAVRRIIKKLAAERALANETMIGLARQELEAAYTSHLAGPDDDGRWTRRRWAKE